MSGADAVLQEITALRERFGGEVINLYPFGKLAFAFPRFLYGLPTLPRLAAALRQRKIVHLYHAAPYGFPVMRLAKRVIFTVTAGLGPEGPEGDRGALDRVGTLVVSDEGERDILRDRGYGSVEVVPPAVDTAAFSHTPCPPGKTFGLLIGSSPWTKAQFVTKSILAFLDAVLLDQSLEVTFLWRGPFAADLEREVAGRSIGDRVTIINERVDVNDVLRRVSAAAVICRDPAAIRAYPHSLLDSLAAGKPVIVSGNLPMAKYVGGKGCGVVAGGWSAKEILHAVEELKGSYSSCQEMAVAAAGDFSLPAMLSSYEKIYRDHPH